MVMTGQAAIPLAPGKAAAVLQKPFTEAQLLANLHPAHGRKDVSGPAAAFPTLPFADAYRRLVRYSRRRRRFRHGLRCAVERYGAAREGSASAVPQLQRHDERGQGERHDIGRNQGQSHKARP